MALFLGSNRHGRQADFQEAAPTGVTGLGLCSDDCDEGLYLHRGMRVF